MSLRCRHVSVGMGNVWFITKTVCEPNWTVFQFIRTELDLLWANMNWTESVLWPVNWTEPFFNMLFTSLCMNLLPFLFFFVNPRTNLATNQNQIRSRIESRNKIQYPDSSQKNLTTVNRKTRKPRKRRRAYHRTGTTNRSDRQCI